MSYLDAIYSAIECDEGLADLAGNVAGFCGTRSGNVTLVDGTGTVVFGQMNYWRESDCVAYHSHYHGQDPWREIVVAQGGVGRAVATDAIMTPRQFASTAMYNDLIRVAGDDTGRCVGLVLDHDGGTLNMGIHRAGRDTAFDAQDVVRLTEVSVHVRRVLRIRGTLAAAASLSTLLSTMLDNSGQPMVLVDSRLVIRHMTASAKAILDRADGIRCRNGAMSIDNPSAALQFRDAVIGAIDRLPASRDALLCPMKSRDSSYRLVVLPAGASPLDGAIVLIGDPSRPSVGDARLGRFARIFALTGAETALVAALADGLRLAEIADQRGVALETVKTHLKHVFLKTGTTRQIDLIRSLMLVPGS